MKYKIKLAGLDCANCANKIETKVLKLKEVDDASLNFNTSTLYMETKADFDDVFENMFSDPFFKGTSTHMRTDVKEVDDNYVLDMELPGFDKKDISIELKDGYLNITANKSTDGKETDNQGNIIRQERFTGTCSRSFYIGDEVKQEDIRASYDNGELKITLPKKAPKEITTNTYIPIE